jgi:hypothetical protein
MHDSDHPHQLVLDPNALKYANETVLIRFAELAFHACSLRFLVLVYIYILDDLVTRTGDNDYSGAKASSRCLSMP